MNRKSFSLCLGALLFAPALWPAQAQFVAAAPCAAHSAPAVCSGVVAAPTISAANAAVAKAEYGRAVLLFDVRSHMEAAFGGRAPQADALVPYAEVAQPLRWDDATGAPALVPTADFVELARAWVAFYGGDSDTPLLLLCRTGAVAAQAAAALRQAGFTHVLVVQGGIDGVDSEDGPQYAGWKASGLPWLARADAVFLVGDGD